MAITERQGIAIPSFHSFRWSCGFQVDWSKGAGTGVLLRLKDPLLKPDNGNGKAAFYSANQVQIQIGPSGSLKRDMTGSLYVGGSSGRTGRA